MSLNIFNKKDYNRIINIKNLNEYNTLNYKLNYKIDNIIDLLNNYPNISNLILDINNTKSFYNFLKNNKSIIDLTLLNKCSLDLYFLNYNNYLNSLSIIDNNIFLNEFYKTYYYNFNLIKYYDNFNCLNSKLILLNFNDFELLNFNSHFIDLSIINNDVNNINDINIFSYLNNSYVINDTNDFTFFKKKLSNVKINIINKDDKIDKNNFLKNNSSLKDLIIVNYDFNDFNFFKNNQSLINLNLSNFDFNKNNLFINLCEVIKYNNSFLNSLDLSYCNLNSKNCELLFKSLMNDEYISELNLSHNNIQNLKNINLFLKNTYSLTSLNLSFNPFVKISNICEGLLNNKSLTDLNLEKEINNYYFSENLSEKDIQKLYDTLKYNTSLIKLNLKGINNISLDVFNALRYNNSICDLQINILNNYFISKFIPDDIFNILINNSSLISLDVNINKNNYKSFFEFLKSNNNIYKIIINYNPNELNKNIIQNELEEVLKYNIILTDINYQIFII